MSAATPESPQITTTVEPTPPRQPHLLLPFPDAPFARADERPRGGTTRTPGGTARTPGTRTPRRVQWAQAVDDDDALRRGKHALDEAGLDPEAFQNLAQALEQHRSSASTSAVPAQPAPTNYPHYPHLPPTAPPAPVLPSQPREEPHDYFTPRASTSLAPPSMSTLDELSLGPTSPSAEASGTAAPVDFHGEIYVDPDERAGLPGSPPDSASALVRAHTRRRRVFPSFPKLRLAKKGAPVRRGRDTEKEREKSSPRDVEHRAEAAGAGAGFGVGGGILAALLSLYDQDEPDDLSSGATSGRSTPARHRSPARWRARSRQSSQERPADGSAPTSPASKRFSLPDLGTLVREARPPKERSAAGVFGPLIAATAGAAAGPAAPATSTIVPNMKRPGFHLTRYDMDAGAAPTSRMHAHARARPRSEGSPPDASPPMISSPANSITPLRPPQLERTATNASGSSHFPFFAPPNNDGGPAYKSKWSEVLSLPGRAVNRASGMHSLPATPGSVRTFVTDTETDGEDGGAWGEYEKRGGRRREREREERDERRRAERRRRKKKAEIFITRHISDLLARQTFVLKLARAMMMFGGPTHRLAAQLQSTARVLEISLSCMYLPDTMLVSFDDEVTATSSVRLIKQGSALDLAKLTFAYKVYWAVIHDEMSVKEASTELDELMRTKPTYRSPWLILFGGFASAAICSVSFNGSLVDSLVSFPLGCILVAVQILSARNELYSNVFEITITCLISFVAAALAETHKLCYSAIASASVVLILPGYLVLCGSLELSSRNITSGSVRLCYALIYSLFLGFGLAIGAEVYTKMRGIRQVVGSEDYSCAASHDPHIWWRATPSPYWAFLTVPMFSLFLSLRNHAPLFRRELPLLVLFSCAGWVTNHFTAVAFPNQSDISSAVGAFAVGMIANIYGRVWKGNAFVVMITGILFQLPSGLGNGGLLTFASQQTSGNGAAYLSGFQTALQLISTCIGLTVGLGVSLALIFPIQSRKRAAGVFSL